jgi:threonine efflux protein
MTFWHGFLVLTLIHLLAAASPGPDFVLVTRESIRAGRRAGLLTSLGIALGLAVHIAYSAAGVAALIVRSELLLHVVEVLGACFLLYLGVGSLRARAPNSQMQDIHEPRATQSSFVARGFLCNLLNPKAPLYFLALFTAVIPANTPTSTLFIYGSWLVCLQWLWFAAVATLFSHARIRLVLFEARVWVERVFGVSMIALAIRLLWSAAME